MGRKLKYNEPTKTVSFKVPISLIPNIKEDFDKLILLKLKNNSLDNDFKECYKDICGIFKIDPNEKPIVTNFTLVKNGKSLTLCDCKLDENGLLRRGKIKCNKTKDEHKF